MAPNDMQVPQINLNVTFTCSKQVEPIIGAVTVDEIAQTCGVSVPGECAVSL